MNKYSNDRQSSTTVIFLHLPKAAGTTLKDILHRQYPSDEVYQLDNTHFIEAQEKFKQLGQQEKAKLKIVTGHMYFGLHEYLASTATYITMLRNPIDRVVSYYYFVKNLPTHEDYELIKTKNISLKEYCQMPRENMNNGQTRFLSGTREFENCGNDMLAVAKQNLQKHFLLAGIQERFDESLLLLQEKLGWTRKPYYYQRNTNRSKSYAQLGITPDTLATIEKYNELDLELYKYVNKSFERELELQQQNVQLFKLTNKLYGRYSVFARKLIS